MSVSVAICSLYNYDPYGEFHDWQLLSNFAKTGANFCATFGKNGQLLSTFLQIFEQRLVILLTTCGQA